MTLPALLKNPEGSKHLKHKIKHGAAESRSNGSSEMQILTVGICCEGEKNSAAIGTSNGR